MYLLERIFRNNRLSTLLLGALLGMLVGAAMGINFIDVANPRDGLILGACVGLIVGSLVAANHDKVDVSAIFTKQGGVFVLFLIGALLGTFVATIVTTFSAMIGGVFVAARSLYILSALVGAGLGASIGLSLQFFPGYLITNGPKWIWPFYGRLLEVTAVATAGLLIGASSGALLAAIGGGLFIAGMFWSAMATALIGGLIGATVGTLVGAVMGTRT